MFHHYIGVFQGAFAEPLLLLLFNFGLVTFDHVLQFKPYHQISTAFMFLSTFNEAHFICSTLTFHRLESIDPWYYLLSNWRPGSVLCAPTKIMETVLYQKLQAHIQLPSTQHAEQKLCLCMGWGKHICQPEFWWKQVTGQLITDMSAAFNPVTSSVMVKLDLMRRLTVWHNMTKIKSYV